ncbi:Sucrose nonfermenting 4-like protein [Glycine soja]|nr:Sucrose nonfermenting 4-like protein [Glycine soja]
MGIHGSNLTEEQLETHTIAVWRETQECRTDSNGRTYPQHMVHVSAPEPEVSSIPIVDNNDSLLDINSRRDIIALVKDKVYARISLSGFSIHQALLLGRDARFSCRLHNGPRCHMCLRSDSLHKERLANPGVRQLVVIEAGSRLVEGIISIGNVFRILLS